MNEDQNVESGAHEARVGQAEIYHEKQERKAKKSGRPKKADKEPDVKKEWYEEINGKIVKKMQLKNGNTHSLYVGRKGEVHVPLGK